jgi:hypothetical protein
MALCVVLIIAAGSARAQQADGLRFSTEVKSGLNFAWDSMYDKSIASIMNIDDGGAPGRLRVDFEYNKGFLTLKWRLQSNSGSRQWNPLTTLEFFFVKARLLDEQIALTVGKIDESPYSLGGDELWYAPYDFRYDGRMHGIALDWSPYFVPGFTAGFFFDAKNNGNYDNDGFMIGGTDAGQFFAEMGFGVRYDNDAIDIRFGGELDSDYDDLPDDQKGASVVYSIRPKIFSKWAPGLRVWLIGDYIGIPTAGNGTTVPDKNKMSMDWVHIHWGSGDLRKIGVNVGYETWMDHDYHLAKLSLKPVFEYSIPHFAVVWSEFLNELVVSYNQYYKPKDANGNQHEPSLYNKLRWETRLNFQVMQGLVLTPLYIFTYEPAFNARKDALEDHVRHDVGIRVVYQF